MGRCSTTTPSHPLQKTAGHDRFLGWFRSPGAAPLLSWVDYDADPESIALLVGFSFCLVSSTFGASLGSTWSDSGELDYSTMMPTPSQLLFLFVFSFCLVSSTFGASLGSTWSDSGELDYSRSPVQ
jgi:hypothetical protein